MAVLSLKEAFLAWWTLPPTLNPLAQAAGLFRPLKPSRFGCPPFLCLWPSGWCSCLLLPPLPLPSSHLWTRPSSVWSCLLWTFPGVSASASALPFIYSKLSLPPTSENCLSEFKAAKVRENILSATKTYFFLPNS